MTHQSLRVVLHGGLGNQLFQLFAATSYALNRGTKSIEINVELLGEYATERCFELEPLLSVSGLPSCHVTSMPILARLRFPKIFARITGRDRIILLPLLGTFVDGYFQSLSDYSPQYFPQMIGVLAAWRESLRHQGRLAAAPAGRLVHIRLGDFFDQPEAALAHAVERLRSIDGPADIVTDSESILVDASRVVGREYELRISPSSGLTAWEVLHLMSGYSQITTNGSTLAFWAALLSGALLETTDSRHQALINSWGMCHPTVSTQLATSEP